MIHSVLFRNENVSVHVPAGATQRKVCLGNGVDPYPVLGGLLSCHGKGFCGTCLVGVDDPARLSPPTKREARWLKRHGAPSGLRLSCQSQVQGDLIVTTDPPRDTGWHAHEYYSGRIDRPWERVRQKLAGPATPAEPPP